MADPAKKQPVIPDIVAQALAGLPSGLAPDNAEGVPAEVGAAATPHYAAAKEGEDWVPPELAGATASSAPQPASVSVPNVPDALANAVKASKAVASEPDPVPAPLAAAIEPPPSPKPAPMDMGALDDVAKPEGTPAEQMPQL